MRNCHLLGVLCSLLILLFSCQRKTAVVIEAPERTTPDSSLVIEIKSDTLLADQEVFVDTTKIINPKKIFVVASLQKSGCYGKCPAFEVQLFSDGRLTWNGIGNVDMSGRWEAWTDTTFYQALIAKARLINYFSLADQYPEDGNFLTDLPSTTTYLKDGIDEKIIRNNYKSPKALRSLETYFEQLVSAQHFEQIEPGN